MEEVLVKEVLTRRDFLIFLKIPWVVNQKDPNWVAPLLLEQRLFFNASNPFFKTSRLKKWVAYKNKRPVGRIVCGVNETNNHFHNEKCAFWGFFDCIQDQEVAKKLFAQAENYAKKEGMTFLRGPQNPSSNHDWGLLVEGESDPPQVMMPYNPPYYKDFLVSLGHKKAMDLLAWKLSATAQMPEKILKISERKEKSEGITYRPLNLKNWDQEVELMFSVYNDAWEKNWGFVPMDKEEFVHTCKGLKMIVDQELVIFVEVKGECVGFLVALPDLYQVLKKIPDGKLFPFGILKILARKRYINRLRILTMGIKKAYRNWGLETLLYTKITQVINQKSNQYKEVEMSWILETNKKMNRPLELMNAKMYKTYRVFEKEL